MTNYKYADSQRARIAYRQNPCLETYTAYAKSIAVGSELKAMIRAYRLKMGV